MHCLNLSYYTVTLLFTKNWYGIYWRGTNNYNDSCINKLDPLRIKYNWDLRTDGFSREDSQKTSPVEWVCH